MEVGRSRGRLQGGEGRFGHSAREVRGASGGGCGARSDRGSDEGRMVIWAPATVSFPCCHVILPRTH
jgi:hypothetical protein